MLQSDWLVSEVSEEPDMLRSSPANEELKRELEASRTEEKESNFIHSDCTFNAHNPNLRTGEKHSHYYYYYVFVLLFN